MLLLLSVALAAEPSFPAPPVVIRSVPVAGAELVDPASTELRVTFDRPMLDGNWSFTVVPGATTPDITGQPRFLADRRTCVLPVTLRPGVRYALGVNYGDFTNFMDGERRRALPWVLTFATGATGAAGAAGAADPDRALLDLATAVADDLARGRHDAVAARGDARMRATVPAAELARVWREATTGIGALVRLEPARSETADGHRVGVVVVRHAQGAVAVRVVAGDGGVISGLWLHPVAP